MNTHQILSQNTIYSNDNQTTDTKYNPNTVISKAIFTSSDKWGISP